MNSAVAPTLYIAKYTNTLIFEKINMFNSTPETKNVNIKHELLIEIYNDKCKNCKFEFW